MMRDYGANTPEPAHAWPPLQGDLAVAALNLVNVGLIVLSVDGRILAANTLGAQRLRSRDGLQDDGGRLAATSAVETTLLRHAIDEAAQGGISTAVALRAGRGDRPRLVVMRPVGSGPARVVILAIRDAAQASSALRTRTSMMFDLGPAEADIVSQLVNGSDLHEIADIRHVAVNTVRTQLASAMLKIGVRRQAELVGVVAGVDMLV